MRRQALQDEVRVGREAGVPGVLQTQPGRGREAEAGREGGVAGAQGGGRGRPRPGAVSRLARPSLRGLLHVLLELLHVALELGAAVLEPADHLQQHGLVTIRRYRVLMFNIDALSHRKQPVYSVQCGCGGGVHVLCSRDNHVVSAPLWRVSPHSRTTDE